MNRDESKSPRQSLASHFQVYSKSWARSQSHKVLLRCLLGCPHVFGTVRDRLKQGQKGGTNGSGVTRWIRVRTHACTRRLCRLFFLHIGTSQTVQSDRRKLCRDNPSAVSLNHGPAPPISQTHTLKDTHTHLIAYRPEQTEWYEYLKKDWGNKKEKWYRPWIWYHKYIVCISHGPVSWSLYVCMCG